MEHTFIRCLKVLRLYIVHPESFRSKGRFTMLCKVLRCIALRCGYFWLRCDALRMIVHNACVSMREMRRII